MSSNGERENINLDDFIKSAEYDVQPMGRTRERRASKEYSAPKTSLGIIGAVGAIAIGASVFGIIGFANGAADRLTLKTETIGKVVDPGKAEIVHVSMDMPPITLATAETKVSGVKVAFEQKLTGLFNISLGSNTVTRDANVETLITVDPGEVNIDYDSEKDKLTFSALDAALSTKVDIPTGEAHTVDKTGSLVMLPAQILTQISDAVDGTFGTDNSKVPIVRDMAAGTLNMNEALEQYADLNIVTGVDKECTPLIPKKVKDFTEQLKDNIRTAVKGELLDDTRAKNDVSSALEALPLSKIQKLVDNSTVELPDNFTIGPDEDNITKLDDYKKSDFLTATLDPKNPIACGVSDDTKLSLVDKAGS